MKNHFRIYLEAVGIMVGLIAVIFVVVGILNLADQALSDQEVQECHQLKHYSETIASFYLEQWQKDMCDSHGIIISSPVEKNKKI